jgi:hypothetical protein
MNRYIAFQNLIVSKEAKVFNNILQYQEKVKFYFDIKQQCIKYNFITLDKVREIGEYLDLHEEIQKIIFNLCYDNKADLRDIKYSEVPDDQKQSAQKKIDFFEDNSEKCISVADMPNDFIKDKFLLSFPTIDFSRQELRSLRGVQMIMNDSIIQAQCKAKRLAGNTENIYLNFQDNLIQEIDESSLSAIKEHIVIDLGKNPLSSEAKEVCKKINGPLKTIYDFDQYLAKREKLIGWLKLAGYGVESLLVLSSLVGLWQLNKRFSNQLIGIAGTYIPSSIQYVKKISPYLLGSLATIGSLRYGGPFAVGIQKLYIPLHTNFTHKYLNFVLNLPNLRPRIFIKF